MTGYGIIVYPRGRVPVFGGLSSEPHVARRHAQVIASANNVRKVEVDRWERGRIVEIAVHRIEAVS